MSQQAKRIVRRIIDQVWNRGNYAVINELVARDYLGHWYPGDRETQGPEGYQEDFVLQRRIFPRIHYTIEDQVAEGDKVATRWTAHTLPGLGSGGKEGRMTGISIFRIASGCIIECWSNTAPVGINQQGS